MRILPLGARGVVDRFRRNSVGYFTEFRFFLAITFVAALLDGLSTIHFMKLDGPDQEMHPAVRIVSNVFGTVAGPVIGKVCQLAAIMLVTIYLRPQAKYIFLVVVVLYGWAAWFNVWGRHIYVPRVLEWFG